MKKSNKLNKGLVQDFSVLNQPDSTYTFSMNGRLSKVGDLLVWTNEQGIGLEFSIPTGFIVIGACDYIDRYLFMFINNPTTGEGGFCWYDTQESVVANRFVIKQWNPSGDGVTFVDMLTTLFDFPANTMVECFARGDVDGSINVYFTDNTNPLRVINTLKVYTTANFGQINLVPEAIFPSINSIVTTGFDFVVEEGGQLMTGNYIYFFRYKDANFNYSNWSGGTGAAVVGNGVVGSPTGTINFIDFAGGGRPGTTTNKRVRITFDNLDTTYKFIDIAYVWFNGQSAEVWMFQNIAYLGSSFVYNHTEVGGQNQIPLDLTSLSSSQYNLIAKSITTIDNRLFAANIKYNNTHPDFLRVANNLIIDYGIIDSTETDQVQINGLQWRDKDGNVYSSNLGDFDESRTYKNAELAGKNVGYWRDELYQFAIVFQFPNGVFSPAYPIGLYRDWSDGIMATAIKSTKYSLSANAPVTGTYRMPPRYRNNPGQPNPKDVWWWDGATFTNRCGEVLYEYVSPLGQNDPVTARILIPKFYNDARYPGFTLPVGYEDPFTIIDDLLTNKIIQGWSIVRSARIPNIQYSTIGWSGIQSKDFPAYYTRPAEKIIPYLYASTDEPYTQYDEAGSGVGVRQEDTILPQYLLELRDNTLFLWSSDYVLTVDTPNTVLNSSIPQGLPGVIKVLDVSSFYDWKGDYATISPATPTYDFNNNNGFANTDWGIFYGMNYRDEIADASGADGELLCSLWDPTGIGTDEVYLLYIATRRYLHEKTTTNVTSYTTNPALPLASLGSDDRVVSLPIYHFGDVDPADWYEGRVVGGYSIQNGYKVEGTKHFVSDNSDRLYLTDGDVGCVLPSHYCVDTGGIAIYDRTGLATEYDNKVYHANICLTDIENFVDADIANYYPIPSNQVYYFCNNLEKVAPDPFLGIKIFNGDCYINRNVLKIFYSINRYKNAGVDPANQMYPRVFGFITENNYNHVFRYDDFEDVQPINGLVGSNMDKFLASTQAFQLDNNTGTYNRKEALFYNQGNHQNLGGKQLLGFDSTNLLPEQRFPVRIAYSEQDDYNTQQDLFRIFIQGNHKDYNISFGEINKIIELNNQLFSIQSKAINRHVVNERAVFSETNNIALKIGSGEVLLGKPDYLSTILGSQHQWSITKSLSHVYGVHKIANRTVIWRFGGQDGLIELSTAKLIRSTVDALGQFRYNNDTPLQESGIVTAFNPNTRDVYFTFLDPFNSRTITFSEITDSFISEQQYYPAIYMSVARLMFATNDHVWLQDSEKNQVFRMNDTNNDTVLAPFYYYDHANPDGTVKKIGSPEIQFVVNTHGYTQYGGEVNSSENIAVFDYLEIVSNRKLFDVLTQLNSFQSSSVSGVNMRTRYLERLWRMPFNRDTNTKARFRDNYMKVILTYTLSKEETIILQEFLSEIRESKS